MYNCKSQGLEKIYHIEKEMDLSQKNWDFYLI